MGPEVEQLHSRAMYLVAELRRGRGSPFIDQAIVLEREALHLCPPDRSERHACLYLLADCLAERYKRLRATADLEEAITFAEEALALHPSGHPLRWVSLNTLAMHLSVKYRQLHSVEDVERAVLLSREALLLCPPGHPYRSKVLSNLAFHLYNLYKQHNITEYLLEAIVHERDALALRRLHPHRPMSLICLASYHRCRFIRSKQTVDKEEIFNLFAHSVHITPFVSSFDVSAAKAWILVAEEFQHPTTLLAYETSLQLLVHLVNPLPSLPQKSLVRLKDLSASLAADAFSACLRNGSPTHAVELLEQGRDVFWHQLTCFHSPFDDVVAMSVAGQILVEEFSRLYSLATRALKSSTEDQHDQVYHLNVELQKILTGIRELPGLSRFLLPSLFADLQEAACEGPIIVVNSSPYGCDALVVFAQSDPIRIPLSITKERVQELSSRVRTVTIRAKSIDMTRELAILLREIWDTIVSSVVDFLVEAYPPGSRIWWCPTTEFSHLPLHAAGPYRKGEHNLADLYISSYTQTLASLIDARRQDPLSAALTKRILATGQVKPAGQGEFANDGELTGMGQCINGPATFTSIEGLTCCVSRVTEELGNSQWVHLACRGLANTRKPFESEITLHDGRFTIGDVVQCSCEDAEFAYLAAFHVEPDDKDLRDCPSEMVHLASAMQFASFRSVIGTMWAADECYANRIACAVYQRMVDESGRLDYTRAAYALNETMKTMVDIPFEQKVLYIHVGV